jgi:hypothetical protein
LTSSWPSIFFTKLADAPVTLDMKKNFILSVIISFAMICSCQKQDSTAEQQVTQRKTELDARETALDERDKELSLRETALNERENALAKKEKAAANAPTTAPGAQSQDVIRDAAEVKAERDRRLQQLPPEIRALVPDPSQVNAARAEKDRLTQERLAQGQSAPEQLQSQKQRKLKMSGGAIFPAAEATSPTPSPTMETTSPTQSPAPQ